MGVAHNVKVLCSGEKTVVLAHGFETDQSASSMTTASCSSRKWAPNPDFFDFERYAMLEGYAYDVLEILVELRMESCVFVRHSLSIMAGALVSMIRPDLFQSSSWSPLSPGM